MKVFRVCLCLLLGISLILSVGVVQADPEENSSRIQNLEMRVAYLEKVLEFLRVEEGQINGLNGPHVIFEGANVHFRNGSENTGIANGLGNVIIGYNEKPVNFVPGDRAGSHNFVLGSAHRYDGAAGLVSGRNNFITATGAAVVGGQFNKASAGLVIGGSHNQALGNESTITGGMSNLTYAPWSNITGGYWNQTLGGASYSVVGGGFERTTTGFYDWVAGSLFEDD